MALKSFSESCLMMFLSLAISRVCAFSLENLQKLLVHTISGHSHGLITEYRPYYFHCHPSHLKVVVLYRIGYDCDSGFRYRCVACGCGEGMEPDRCGA